MRTVTAASLVAAALASMAGSAQAQTIQLFAAMTPFFETPPVTSPASGVAVMRIDRATLNFTFDLYFGNLTTPTVMAHLHVAPPGVAGPIILGLDGQPTPNGSPTIAFVPLGVTAFNGTVTGTFPAAFREQLFAGLVYVNVHSQQFPQGEIRGQLVPGAGSAALLAVAGLAAGRRRR